MAQEQALAIFGDEFQCRDSIGTAGDAVQLPDIGAYRETVEERRMSHKFDEIVSDGPLCGLFSRLRLVVGVAIAICAAASRSVIGKATSRAVGARTALEIAARKALLVVGGPLAIIARGASAPSPASRRGIINN
jgi:hypothetical protein